MTAKSSGVTATERMLAKFCGGWPGKQQAGRGKARRRGRRWGEFGAVMPICTLMMGELGWPADGRCPG